MKTCPLCDTPYLRMDGVVRFLRRGTHENEHMQIGSELECWALRITR